MVPPSETPVIHCCRVAFFALITLEKVLDAHAHGEAQKDARKDLECGRRDSTSAARDKDSQRRDGMIE